MGGFVRIVTGTRNQRCGVCESALHALKQLVVDRIIRAQKRIAKSPGIRRTMAFEHHAAQTQKGRTVVASGVNPTLESGQHRASQERRNLGEDIF